MSRDYRSKYHAKKIQTPDGTFDSKKEYDRWLELKLMERIGIITDLQRQRRYELIPVQRIDGKIAERAVTYKADFIYMRNGTTVVEDTKGVRTKDYIIKRKLMLWRYGIRITEI